MFKVTRTSQPQQPVGIDWSNPLCRGLVAALDPSRPTQNLAGGSFTAANYQRGVNRLGNSISAVSTGTVIQSSINLTGDRTILIYGTPKATNTKVWVTTSTGAGAGYWLGINTVFARWSLGGLIESTSPNDLINPSCAVATKSGTLHSLYFNGKLENSGTNSLADGSGLSFLSFGTTSNYEVTPTFGSANLILVFNRALSAAEIKQLSDNPWQIFQPLARNVFSDVPAAGGSPYTLTADTANIAIAGQATGLAFNRVLTADTANTPVAGQATTLAFNRVLTADTANIPIAGSAATLAFNRVLTADTANIPLAGQDATLTYTPVGGSPYTLIADTANVPIAGADAGLSRGYTLAADTANIAISGSDAALIATRKLIAESMAIALSGADATLTYTPFTLPTVGRPTSDTSNAGWTPSTGVDLFAMIDEVTPDAGDYISASSVGAICQMALNTTAYPGTASQQLKFRASSSTGNSVIVRLKEGATTIRSATQVLTAVDTEYTLTLTSGEIAAITSGSLSVELESA